MQGWDEILQEHGTREHITALLKVQHIVCISYYFVHFKRNYVVINHYVQKTILCGARFLQMNIMRLRLRTLRHSIKLTLKNFKKN